MKRTFTLLLLLLSFLLYTQELTDRMHQFIYEENSFWWDSFRMVERKIYLPESRKSLADSPGDILLIPGEKALSPVTIFHLFQSLNLQSQDKVLTVGYSAAYEAALMAYAGLDVYLIQKSLPLPEGQNYQFIRSNGENYDEWINEGPFDAILITSPQQKMEPALLSQLKAGGYLAVPLKTPGGFNQWVLIEKTEESFRLEVLGVSGERK